MRNSLAAILFLIGATQARAAELRICADPNNMPFSNRVGQGFENKIALLMARDLKARPVFVFQRQTDNFIEKGLKAHLCDVVMGLPRDMDEVATTRPYYASTYVFVTRGSDRPIASLRDPRLRRLKIGVHLIGDAAQPPVEALGREGIVQNVKGFMIDGGDYARADPSGRLIEAVSRGEVDVAAVWGPLGGYFARRSPVALTVTPIADTAAFAPLAFQFAIAAGVRKEDAGLRSRLDAALQKEGRVIKALLKSYGVPLVSPEGISHE